MIRPTIAFTSLLTRAQTTLEVVQQKAGLSNIPVIRFFPHLEIVDHRDVPAGDLDHDQ